MDSQSKMNSKKMSFYLIVSALFFFQMLPQASLSAIPAPTPSPLRSSSPVISPSSFPSPMPSSSPLAAVELKKLDQEFFKIAEQSADSQPEAFQALAYKLEELQKKAAPSAELEAQIGRAYGQIALSKGLASQVKLGKLIHDHAEKAIELDPNNALANEVFGLWHFEVSKVGGFAVTFGRLLFGGIPSGYSFESALVYLKRAQEIDEKALFFKLSYAKVLEHEGKMKEAKAVLEAGLKLPDQYPTDKIYRKEAEELLKQID